jgi:hypothetical protein
MFDAKGKLIDVLARGTVATLPPSITELGLSEADDDRTSKNLFTSGEEVFLAPLCRNMTEEERRLSIQLVQKNKRPVDDAYCLPKCNVLLVMFDLPVTISSIRYCFLYQQSVDGSVADDRIVCSYRFKNYSKTPARGVKDLALLVDGAVVYMGSLPAAAADRDPPQADVGGGHTVLFTNDAATLRAEKSRIGYCGNTDQDVLCINERQVMVRSRAMYDKPSPLAEGIHTDISQRPQTMMTKHKR